MPYSLPLAERTADALRNAGAEFEARPMMGGLCFLVDGKMCAGIVGEELMARIGPDAYGDALEKEGCKEMTFTGRPMKGFVFIEQEVLDDDDDLTYWIDLCLAFNPKAKARKKK